MAQGFGGAGIALMSSFFALGALLSEAGLHLWQGAFCTFAMFALPGQITAAELFAADAGIAVIVASVLLVNMRLLPMTIALLPILRPPAERRWHDFLTAHLIAVTSWVSFMGTHDELPAKMKYRYFVWMGATFWLCGIAATVLGYAAADALAPWLLAGLLFLNPVYFLCMMIRAVRTRRAVAALVAGVLLLPPLHSVAGEWDIIAAGIIGGGAAFWFAPERQKS